MPHCGIIERSCCACCIEKRAGKIITGAKYVSFASMSFHECVDAVPHAPSVIQTYARFV
jgi:hypothetical protein